MWRVKRSGRQREIRGRFCSTKMLPRQSKNWTIWNSFGVILSMFFNNDIQILFQRRRTEGKELGKMLSYNFVLLQQLMAISLAIHHPSRCSKRMTAVEAFVQ